MTARDPVFQAILIQSFGCGEGPSQQSNASDAIEGELIPVAGVVDEEPDVSCPC